MNRYHAISGQGPTGGLERGPDGPTISSLPVVTVRRMLHERFRLFYANGFLLVPAVAVGYDRHSQPMVAEAFWDARASPCVRRRSGAAIRLSGKRDAAHIILVEFAW